MAAVQLVRFGTNQPPVETGKPGNVISGDPTTRLQNYFTDDTAQFYSGIWESSPGKWRVSYSESEFCGILSGRVILTAADGKAQEFKAGDAFVIPAGFEGTWETLEPVRKWYAIFEARKE
jgi:uncharacterized cupin superfamily protein